MARTMDDMFDDPDEPRSDGEIENPDRADTFVMSTGRLNAEQAARLKDKIEKAFAEAHQEGEPGGGPLDANAIQKRREQVIEYLLPDLDSVTDLPEAAKFYDGIAARIISHDITCREKQCKLCLPGRVMPCTVRRFRNFLEFYFSDLTENGDAGLKARAMDCRMK